MQFALISIRNSHNDWKFPLFFCNNTFEHSLNHENEMNNNNNKKKTVSKTSTYTCTNTYIILYTCTLNSAHRYVFCSLYPKIESTKEIIQTTEAKKKEKKTDNIVFLLWSMPTTTKVLVAKCSLALYMY